MTSNGYLPLIIQPTRITDTSKSLIDNIFTNTFTKESQSGNILLEIADHLTQFVSIHNVETCPENESYYFKRDDSNWKEDLFLDDLSIQNWETNSEDPNLRYKDMLMRYESCINRHLPLKKMTKKEIKMKRKPWITPVIIRKIKHRNSLFARKKLDPDNIHLKSAYKRFRNSVNRDIKSSKKAHYTKYFDNCKNSMKKTWKGINELINTKNKSHINISQLNHNNSPINDPNEIANTFNNFFTNVGPNLDKEIPKTPISPLSYLNSRVTENFAFKDTTISEVMIILLQLDDKKSSGPSDIPIKLLKIAAPIIVPHLVSIFNLSFKTGIFPNMMKLAKVIPIFKTGSKLLVTNYRPISLLSVFTVKSLKKLYINKFTIF